MTLTQKLVLGFLFALVLQVAQMWISASFTAQMQEASEQVSSALAASMAVQGSLDAARAIEARAHLDAQPERAVDASVYRVYVGELQTRSAELERALGVTQEVPVGPLLRKLDDVVASLAELERAAQSPRAEAARDAVAFLDDAVGALAEALQQTQLCVRAFAQHGVELERSVQGRPMRASLAITLGGVVLMAAFIAWFSRQLVVPIQRAWAELEQRVQERTVELASTVGALERQIAERERAEARTRELNELLVSTSRRAGMAELANGVLHNVGNVLNSVNVSTNVLLDRLQKSRADGLQRAVELIDAHAADLGAFLTSSPQGRKLPPYLATLATHLVEERAALVRETKDLSAQVDHMKAIVSRQQSYARVSGTLERARPGQLVDDVLALQTASFQRHDIRIVRRTEFDEECELDRSRVLQILLNLVTNARHALVERGGGGALLEIAVARHGADRVRISVVDNGVGISAENLTKVFAHGFTTKRDGHGFGLHHSANAAAEMSGRLWAESAGPGQGATFVLELPIHAATTAAPVTATAP